MIFDYAIEPQLVTTWGSLRDFRYFSREFGLGSPRIMAEFPKKKNWRKLFAQAATTLPDLEQARAAALANHLLSHTAARSLAEYDGLLPWLENAEEEHSARPFRAILARENPGRNVAVLTPDSFDANASWLASVSAAPARNRTDLVRLLGPLLRVSDEIVIVEPHFDPQHPRFCSPLQDLLRATSQDRPSAPARRIELVAGDNQADDHFARNCLRYLPQFVPAGLRLLVRKLRQRSGGEKLHDRFLLTELGGISLGTGFDDGEAGQTQTVNILADSSVYTLRWEQYASTPGAFDMSLEIPIDGEAR